MISEIPQAERCKSCGAHVWWLKHTGTQRPAPINVEPDPKGNCVINLEAKTYTTLGRLNGTSGLPHYTNHFMTCPQAKSWKKGEPKGDGRRKR